MNFPLLKLPHLPLIDTVQRMDFASILNLSFCSKRLKGIVKLCKLPVNYVETKYRDDGECHVSVMVRMKDYKIFFKNAEHEKDIGMIRQDTHEETEFHFFGRDNKDKRVEELVEKVLTIVPTRTTKAFSTRRKISKMDLSKISDLLINASIVSIESKTVSKKEFRKVFEKFRNIKHLLISAELLGNYRLEGVKLDYMQLFDKTILKPIDFLNMKVDNFVFHQSTVSATDMNLFIRKWLEDSGKPSLKSITAYRIDHDSFVLSGIKHSGWEPTARSQLYVMPYLGDSIVVNCRFGQDILRDDGVLASVISSETYLRFLVWTDRFHELPRKTHKWAGNVKHDNGFNNGTNGTHEIPKEEQWRF